jgi:hypothetical protein
VYDIIFTPSTGTNSGRDLQQGGFPFWQGEANTLFSGAWVDRLKILYAGDSEDANTVGVKELVQGKGPGQAGQSMQEAVARLKSSIGESYKKELERQKKAWGHQGGH